MSEAMRRCGRWTRVREHCPGFRIATTGNNRNSRSTTPTFRRQDAGLAVLPRSLTMRRSDTTQLIARNGHQRRGEQKEGMGRIRSGDRLNTKAGQAEYEAGRSLWEDHSRANPLTSRSRIIHILWPSSCRELGLARFHHIPLGLLCGFDIAQSITDGSARVQRALRPQDPSPLVITTSCFATRLCPLVVVRRASSSPWGRRPNHRGPCFPLAWWTPFAPSVPS